MMHKEDDVQQPWRPEEAEGDWEFTEEDFLAEESESQEQPLTQRKWLKRFVIMLMAAALVANAFAVIPLIYNWNVIQFLKVTQALSQDETVQAYKKAIVVVTTDNSKGTGFNIDKRGMIITNHHVVEDASTAVIGFPDKLTFHADVVLRDVNADLAVLKLRAADVEDLPVLEVDASAPWTEGMPVYYIGNPLFFHHIVGKGTVLGLMDIANKPMPVMVIDAPVYSGNSGSPVISEEGKVIAVLYATAEITQDGQRLEVGLAIPTDHPYFQ